ncbi:LacI family transcriptional regulator [Motilibacter rhizosphaerae]|uniref:LacI family transcriptional regulator n=1 Tax=Motilibacter rhizosphaerae TaxID=598652 RepID=A0A4Q7NXL9_9ACTN|nr:LacI family DNA-binding transcriptional regulator [Motilibacter rhizosphaerae]RZS91142.1 LacI family transcriptional regulator [Motilibacter rhizosphaerae]
MTESPSQRRPTILDVARAAGVSRAAVSKVIRDAYGVSPAMRERVLAAIEELDYRPSAAARGLRGSSYTIGMELPHLTNPFLTEIADGARQALLGTPYHLVVAPAAGPERGAIEALVDHRVDGIIAISPLVQPDWLEELALRVPLVMVGIHDDAASYDTVVGDDVEGARQVMGHLLGLGHRRIAHLTEGEEVTAARSTPHALRLQSYLECMREAGLERHVRVVHVKNEQDEARDATLALLREPDRPSAVFAAHDSLAIGALAAISESGLTASDVAVVGYDNIALAGHPLISLTSVDQSGRSLGQQAVAMIRERLEGRADARRFMAQPRLVVRSSSAAAAASVEESSGRARRRTPHRADASTGVSPTR